MAMIEVLSGDFEEGVTRIRYSDAGRALLRLRSADGHVEDLFLETEVVGVVESADETGAVSRLDRGKCRFVVTLRGGRKFVALGDRETMIEFECAAVPAERRREWGTRLQMEDARRGLGIAARLRAALIGRTLAGDR